MPPRKMTSDKYKQNKQATTTSQKQHAIIIINIMKYKNNTTKDKTATPSSTRCHNTTQPAGAVAVTKLYDFGITDLK